MQARAGRCLLEIARTCTIVSYLRSIDPAFDLLFDLLDVRRLVTAAAMELFHECENIMRQRTLPPCFADFADVERRSSMRAGSASAVSDHRNSIVARKSIHRLKRAFVLSH
jgi:hypothetical protein